MNASRYTQQAYDSRRAVLRETILFHPLLAHANNTRSLAEALQTDTIAPSDALLVFSLGDTTICLSLAHMIYHHVAQGVLPNGQAWLVSFCVVCNAGMAFDPRVNGTPHHFADGGFYNAMTLLVDRETRSVWNHLTGECLEGAHKGTTLLQIANPLQRTASQVLIEYPEAILVIDILDESAQKLVDDNAPTRLSETMTLSERWQKSLVSQDARLPRFEMGLGVWTDTAEKFYPYRTVLMRHNAVLDTFDGRKLLVVASPDDIAPEAFFTTATRYEWYGDDLLLEGGGVGEGQVLRRGILYDAHGKVITPERPQQLFQRWYSFILLFEGAPIYADSLPYLQDYT
jgi:hypothetical protein